MESVGSDQDGGAPSKVSDSGVGGLESGEDSWISDTEVSETKSIHNCRFDCLSGSVYLDVFLSIILQVVQPKGE